MAKSDVSTEGWTEIGTVGVDSGQIMVGDPCYLDKWGGHEFTSHGKDDEGKYRPTGTYDYDGACTATCSPESVGVLGNGLAAVVSSGYGDGQYGVYVKHEDAGMGKRVAAVMVVFCEDEPEEEESCYNCGGEITFSTCSGLCDDCEAEASCDCGNEKDPVEDMCGDCQAERDGEDA